MIDFCIIFNRFWQYRINYNWYKLVKKVKQKSVVLFVRWVKNPFTSLSKTLKLITRGYILRNVSFSNFLEYTYLAIGFLPCIQIIIYTSSYTCPPLMRRSCQLAPCQLRPFNLENCTSLSYTMSYLSTCVLSALLPIPHQDRLLHWLNCLTQLSYTYFFPPFLFPLMSWLVSKVLALCMNNAAGVNDNNANAYNLVFCTVYFTPKCISTQQIHFLINSVH